MRYISTRGQAPELSFEEAMLTGLARDGGLYVPAQVPQIPHLALSHTIPSRVFSWRWAQGLFGFPPAVVLIRDVRKSLESVYVKWLLDEPAAKRPDFATYVAGDPWQRHPPAST